MMRGEGREENRILLKILRSSPLFLYSSIYISGIFFAGFFPLGTNYSILFSTSTVIILVGLYFFSFYETLPEIEYQNNLKFLKVSLVLTFFSIGILNISLKGYYENIRKNSKIDASQSFSGAFLINETPVEQSKFMKFSVKSIKYDESILLYLYKNIYSGKYEIGDTLIITLKPVAIDKTINRNNFDYARYLKKRGIYSTAFVSKDKPILKKCENPGLRLSIIRARERIIEKLYRLIDNAEIHATMVALTTGVKSYLTKDIKKTFSSSGTMHLLAVSGLHVGFIYSIMVFITSIFGNFRYSVIARSLFIVLALWVYALFTGMAPSIERAVIMATVYQIGTLFEKKKNSLNALSLSAFIICIFNPGSVFDAGFQLSYAAVFSIILINPFIATMFKPKIKILKYIWSTISISTSCQIGTSVLTIYYFQFVPVYFMISNLIAIPLSSLIIISTLALVVTLGSGAESFLIPLVKFLIEMLNRSMEIIASLPYSTIDF